MRYMNMLTSNLHSYIFYGRRSAAFKLLSLPRSRRAMWCGASERGDARTAGRNLRVSDGLRGTYIQFSGDEPKIL